MTRLIRCLNRILQSLFKQNFNSYRLLCLCENSRLIILLFKQNFYTSILNYMYEPFKSSFSRRIIIVLCEIKLFTTSCILPSSPRRHAANRGTIGRIASMRNIRTYCRVTLLGVVSFIANTIEFLFSCRLRTNVPSRSL